jgi:uncharacterized membrane protein
MPETKEAVEEIKDGVEDKATGDGNGLAKKLIGPAAAGLGTIAASYAAKKGPELIKDKVLPMLEGKGQDEAQKLGKSAAEGAKESVSDGGGIAGKVAGKLMGGGGDDDDSDGLSDVRGWGKGRRLPIQASIDVAAPITKVFDAWKNYEELPEFMHRVESVDKQGDDKLVWHENIWGIRRDWTAQIVEEKRPQIIAWRSQSRGGNTGVVTFHRLAERLTRVEVNMDFQPGGMLEKMASGLRFHKRAAKTDLKRFKAYVEMKENAHGTTAEGEDGDEQEEPKGSESPKSSSSPSDGSSRTSGEADKDRKQRGQRREQRREKSASK